MRAIGEDRSNLLRRNVEYHLTISDTLGSYGGRETLPDHRLVATIECSGCGYLKIGPAIEAMEKNAEGLGSAFYWELVHACYRVMRIYDHSDALQYEENMREMVEHEEDATQQYEFPEVAKTLPASIQRDLVGDDRRRSAKHRQVLRAARAGEYGGWIDRLRRLKALGRLQVTDRKEYPQDSYYDSPPLPSLLLAFEEHDAITACFDEEGQHMLEGVCEPALLVCFDPRNQDEVRRAIGAVSRFIGFNHQLFELTEELVAWEKNNEHPAIDRTNAPI
jgi:hypothetical protein